MLPPLAIESVMYEGMAMNERLERHAAGIGHAACIAAAPLGESIWRIRARSTSLQFDHVVLGELIARRWKQDRTNFALASVGD
jgi:hypothetical protein